MLGAEEEAHRPYPLGKTVTSLALWRTSWAMWLGSGMNTPGQIETSMSPSSERTSNQVRSQYGVRKPLARKLASTRAGRCEGEGFPGATNAHLFCKGAATLLCRRLSPALPVSSVVLPGRKPQLVGYCRNKMTFYVVKDHEIQLHFPTGTEWTRKKRSSPGCFSKSPFC